MTQLVIRGKKLNISLVFIKQSYFNVPKTLRLNWTHCFLMKIPKQRELQQIAFNHLSDIDIEDLMNLYRKYTVKSYYFLVIDTSLASDNYSRFRKNLLEGIWKFIYIGIFPIKGRKDDGLKILTPKQILQRLPIALAQVKVVTHPKIY